jgi:hypothetical protein
MAQRGPYSAPPTPAAISTTADWVETAQTGAMSSVAIGSTLTGQSTDTVQRILMRR